ncbi:hypothetical protein M2138_000055 [Dysgonomonadaceae bacterium PH5-43]|nr:hypothetical protein [Dysgonomonadaceae bacterium PH5-43]
MKKIITLVIVAITMFSCNVAEQAAGYYQLTQCKYDYSSISGLTLNGINLQNATSLSSLTPTNLLSLTSAFSSSNGSLPLNFTLNLNVNNPGTTTALLSGMAYVLEIDGREMTTGFLDQALQVAGGSSAVLPIGMSFDLKKVLNGESLESIKNLAFNFAGIGSNTSDVTVKLKPNFNIGGKVISSPTYIPVSFQLNKK